MVVLNRLVSRICWSKGQGHGIRLQVLILSFLLYHSHVVVGQKISSVDLDLDDIIKTIRDDSGSDSSDIATSAKVMLDLFNEMQQQAGDGGVGDDVETSDLLPPSTGDITKADTIRSIPADPVEDDSIEQLSFTIRYNASSLQQKEIIQKAEIRARLPLEYGLNRSTVEANLKHYRLRVLVRHNGRKVKREKFRLNVVGFTADNFVMIDVTNVIKNVTTEANTTTTVQFIVIRKKTTQQRQRTRRFVTTIENVEESQGVKHTEAFLLIFSKSSTPDQLFSSLPTNAIIADDQDDKDMFTTGFLGGLAKARSKRKKFKATLCERVSLIINFKFLGWDKWVLYPKTANLYACRGRCPNRIPPDLMPSNHAILQNLMRSRNRTINAACCSPIDLSPLSIMYQEKKEIVVRHHENMIVERCGCR